MHVYCCGINTNFLQATSFWFAFCFVIRLDKLVDQMRSLHELIVSFSQSRMSIPLEWFLPDYIIYVLVGYAFG